MEETQALVQAMESRVEEVELHGEMTLDIEALTEYNGQGRCKEVRAYGFVATKYKEDMRTWASNRNWRVWLEEEPCPCFGIWQ